MNIIISLFLLYISTSLMEWYIHKFLMHETDNKNINCINNFTKNIYFMIHNKYQSDNHINHHSIVLNNGDVDISDDGMLYSGYNIPFTTVFGFIIYIILSKIINYNHSKKDYIIIFISWIIISSSYYILWNVLHPSYHNYDFVDNNINYIKNNFIYKYLEKYHMIHHFNKGDNKCNFNIILPGMDFLFGTYKNCVDNTDFCKNKFNKTEKEKELCDKQSKNIKLKENIDYCINNS